MYFCIILVLYAQFKSTLITFGCKCIIYFYIKLSLYAQICKSTLTAFGCICFMYFCIKLMLYVEVCKSTLITFGYIYFLYLYIEIYMHKYVRVAFIFHFNGQGILIDYK